MCLPERGADGEPAAEGGGAVGHAFQTCATGCHRRVRGRVIGLVVEDSAEAPSTGTRQTAAPFYRGIPSSEVIRAIDELDFGGIVEMDTWP